MIALPPPFTGFKPMRACSAPDDLTSILYPCLAQTKLDGITAHILCDNKGKLHVFSNTLKYIPCDEVATQLRMDFCEHMWPCTMLSGEVVHRDGFQATQSIVMSKQTNEPVSNWTYSVFDCLDFNEPNDTYLARKQRVINAFRNWRVVPHIRFLRDVEVGDATALANMLQMASDRGHEGLMVRSILGRYKFGDVTPREGYVMKLKPFVDDEAVIVGFNEEHYEDGAAKDSLGSFIVEHKTFGRFNLSGKLTRKQRDEFWAARESMLGQLVTFKYQKIGTKDKPREPIFKGVRYDK